MYDDFCGNDWEDMILARQEYDEIALDNGYLGDEDEWIEEHYNPNLLRMIEAKN